MPAAVLATATAVLPGCGWGRVSAIPFSRTDLRDREPLVYNLPTAGRCGWYLDDKGQMTVAMKYQNLPIFGPLTGSQWVMRMRLGDPPAGSSLRYNLFRDQVRGLCSSGVEHWRFQSRWGVLVLDRLPGRRFKGRFQLSVSQQQFSLFGGWSPVGFRAPLMTMWGEFEAVHDERLGKEVSEAIARENWEDLGVFPATRPATLTTRPVQTRPVRPTTTRAVRPGSDAR